MTQPSDVTAPDVAASWRERAVERSLRGARAKAMSRSDRFIEVGPGNVLAGMVRRTLPEARVISFGGINDLDAVKGLLA